MILEPMANGDTEEDEAVVGIVKINPKQRATIGKGKGKQRALMCKGKQCNQGKLGQQSDHEPHLQIIVGSPADDHFSKFNLAMTMMTGPSPTLIPTHLMTSMSTARMWMTWTSINTSSSSLTRIQTRFPKR